MSRNSEGIALLAVMAALMVLSAIALGLAASVQTEARIDAADWNGLQAEQLARSGQEFAAFLQARSLPKTADAMAGLPLEVVRPGFQYRAQLAAGAVDIYFESDNGKLDLSSAPPEVLTNFFALWTGDFTNGQAISAAIEDWRDADNDVRANGAEAPYYAPLNYVPRNGGLGLADAPLIRGISSADFQLKASQQNGTASLRPGLDAYITSAGAGSLINANFAPDLVLRSIPGLSESQVEAILAARADRIFDDATDLQARLGISSTAPFLKYLTLSRSAPAVLTVSSLKAGSPLSRSERRITYSFSGYNIATGLPESRTAVGRVQRNGVQ
ncbi:MAG TPA: type II secretion system protein GspK [Terriglobia bacterium]|jgi:type II secretory pathway component PulK